MNYSSWDHDYCIDPDEWICYGDCKNCPNVCEQGRELLEDMRRINNLLKERGKK